MKVNETKNFKEKSVTITTTVEHTITEEEFQFLKNINDAQYGYKLGNLEICDMTINKILHNLSELTLITENEDDFSSVYYITEFGKSFLKEQE